MWFFYSLPYLFSCCYFAHISIVFLMCMICMQAEGISVSPYSVRKALENTAVPIGDLPQDKLSTGQGLMQVDKLDNFLSSCFHEI